MVNPSTALAHPQHVTVLRALNAREWRDVFPLPVMRATAGRSEELTLTLGLSVGPGSFVT